jgi:hypothetical protein
LKYFLKYKLAFTKRIKAGTSTKGPITPAKAWPELRPNTPIAIAMANSKLLPEAVKATVASPFGYKKHQKEHR